MAALTTLIIEASALSEALQTKPSELFLLDVRSDEQYSTSHIASAQHLDPKLLNHSAPPQGGLLPVASKVQNWASQLGLSLDSTIVVYDEGKATAAARAVWVLHAYGFTNVHWLDGGIQAWTAQDHPTTNAASAKPTANPALELTLNSAVVLTANELIKNLELSKGAANKRKPVDTRTAGEFAGTDIRSERGGHMPGAVHYEWLDMFTDAGTLKPESELRDAVEQRGLNEQDACVVYCQTHQRSAVTYVVLKHLGFKDVAALDGAWSTWGNHPDTPIER